MESEFEQQRLSEQLTVSQKKSYWVRFNNSFLNCVIAAGSSIVGCYAPGIYIYIYIYIYLFLFLFLYLYLYSISIFISIYFYMSSLICYLLLLFLRWRSLWETYWNRIESEFGSSFHLWRKQRTKQTGNHGLRNGRYWNHVLRSRYFQLHVDPLSTPSISQSLCLSLYIYSHPVFVI